MERWLRNTRNIAVLCLATASTSTAHAQTISLSPPGTPPVFLQLDPPQIGATPVTGAPFTAEGVTVMTQVLADGNRVERRYRSRLARDSAGRFRQQLEAAPHAPPALASGPARMTTIIDPVGGLLYILDDDQLIARRASLPGAPAQSGVPRAMGPQDVVLPSGARPMPSMASPPKTDREELGQKAVESLMCDGVRITTTFPAGAMGNDREVVVVTERWISTELKVPVHIVRKDPRMGETVYRLENVVRAEPAASTFVVPDTYRWSDQSPVPRAAPVP